MAESPNPIIWDFYHEVKDAGDTSYPVGVAHYYDENAQTFYIQNGELKTMTAEVPEGRWRGIDDRYSSEIGLIKLENDILSMEYDHPSNGTIYFAMHDGKSLYYVRYVYMIDASNIVQDWSFTLQADNPIVRYSASVMNVDNGLFDVDTSLFAPGSRYIFKSIFGDNDVYPMGIGFIDEINYSPNGESVSFSGRNVSGFLLKDQTFDDRTSFSGTAGHVIEAMLKYAGIKKYKVQELKRSAKYSIKDTQAILDGIQGVLDLCYNEGGGEDQGFLIVGKESIAKIIELPDGTICVGQASWLEENGYFQNGYYTFNRGSDVFSRKVKKDVDGCYTVLRATGKKRTEDTSAIVDSVVTEDTKSNKEYEESLVPGVEASQYWGFYRQNFYDLIDELNQGDMNPWTVENFGWISWAENTPEFPPTYSKDFIQFCNEILNDLNRKIIRADINRWAIRVPLYSDATKEPVTKDEFARIDMEDLYLEFKAKHEGEVITDLVWMDWASNDLKGCIPPEYRDSLMSDIGRTIGSQGSANYSETRFYAWLKETIPISQADMSEGDESFTTVVGYLAQKGQFFNLKPAEMKEKISEFVASKGLPFNVGDKFVDELFNKLDVLSADSSTADKYFSMNDMLNWAKEIDDPTTMIRDDILSETFDDLSGTDVSVTNNMLEPVSIPIAHYEEWTYGKHRTKHVTAPDGLTQEQLREWAKVQALKYQMAGIQEDFTGPYRPQLQIGDIAEFIKEEGTQTLAVTIGFVTSVTHSFSLKKGYTTDFTVESGGIDYENKEDNGDTVIVGVAASCVNRPTRLVDMNNDLKYLHNRLEVKTGCAEARLNESLNETRRLKRMLAHQTDSIRVLEQTVFWMWDQYKNLVQPPLTTGEEDTNV